MDIFHQEHPVIRYATQFIVEEHLEALAWPQECASCSGVAEIRDAIPLKKKFAGLGEVRMEVTGIPYCHECFPHIQSTRRLKRIVLGVALAFGTPLAILLIWVAGRNDLIHGSHADEMVGILIGFSLFIGYGLALLVIRLPARILLGKRLIKPVDASLFLDHERQDHETGASVSIHIPNKEYARRFATANGITLPPSKGD